MTTPTVPPGIASVPRLESWLTDTVTDSPATVTDIRLIAGGRSNLTYRLTLNTGTQLVLRRPPLGHVLPTAHDMAREFRVISALAGTNVPVAGAVAYCGGTEVIGAPFYLMDYVPGRVLRTSADTAALTANQNQDLSEGLADMLAAIHGVDTTRVGLADLGKGAGYLRRQLDRWQRQWQLSKTRDVPGYDELVAKLTERLPGEGEVTLVHGDFRIDNVLVDVDNSKILAVVDWEMATLGDPLADLGLTLIYWTDPGEESYLNPAGDGLNTDATTSPGFRTRAEFAAGYASRTGRDISQIGYYMAFAYFKLAVVLEGINARYLQHQTVGEGFDREGRAVPVLIARAHETL
jgi:aminoglycoside phosphotransferase (APT) family kinase protein